MTISPLHYSVINGFTSRYLKTTEIERDRRSRVCGFHLTQQNSDCDRSGRLQMAQPVEKQLCMLVYVSLTLTDKHFFNYIAYIEQPTMLEVFLTLNYTHGQQTNIAHTNRVHHQLSRVRFLQNLALMSN